MQNVILIPDLAPGKVAGQLVHHVSSGKHRPVSGGIEARANNAKLAVPDLLENRHDALVRLNGLAVFVLCSTHVNTLRTI
jgi:hypothetical protein